MTEELHFLSVYIEDDNIVFLFVFQSIAMHFNVCHPLFSPKLAAVGRLATWGAGPLVNIILSCGEHVIILIMIRERRD